MPEVYLWGYQELTVARNKVHQKEIKDDGGRKTEGNHMVEEFGSY